jgi:phosphate-selective porin OprO/OprP
MASSLAFVLSPGIQLLAFSIRCKWQHLIWLAVGLTWGLRPEIAAAQIRVAAIPAPFSQLSSTAPTLPNNQLSAAEGSASDLGADSEPTVEKQLEELQQGFDKRLQELEDQLSKQDKAREEAKKKPTFKLNGRIQLDHWSFPTNEPGIGYLEHPNASAANYGQDPEDRLLFRRIRLEMSGDIPQNMLWRMQVDFNDPSNPAFKDVYFGWSRDDEARTFLVGNQKRPLGLDALDSSRYTVFAERPLINDAFVEGSRRVGACFYGYSADESVNWRYGVFNLEDISSSGSYVGDSLQLGGYGRLAATPWYDQANDGRNYYHCALAGAVARTDGNVFPGDSNQNEARFRSRPQAQTNTRWFDTGRIAGADAYEILATESRLNIGRFQLTGETMVNFLQRDATTPGTGSNLFFYGFYVYGSYFLTGEHMPYDRTTGTLERVKPYSNFFLFDRLRGCRDGGGWGAWQIAARYDYIDLTDNDITGGIGHHYTLGLNWHWNAYAKLQTNFILGDIRERGPIGGFDGGNYTIWGTRLMADF